MEDNNRVKVPVIVIQRIYNKNPETQEVIDMSMIEVCSKEGISPEQVVCFFFAAVFIIMAILGKKI